MTDPIEDYVQGLRSPLGPKGIADEQLAEIRDHLLSTASELEQEGVGPADAQRAAVERFAGLRPELVAEALRADLEEGIWMRNQSDVLRPASGMVTLLAVALAASAAMATASNRFAAPVRASTAIVLLALAMIALRRSLLGNVGAIGVVQATIVMSGALLILDRDGLGLGVASGMIAVGIGYSWEAVSLYRARSVRLAVALGLASPIAAGVLRVFAGSSEVALALAAGLLVPFAAALVWLSLLLLRVRIVFGRNDVVVDA